MKTQHLFLLLLFSVLSLHLKCKKETPEVETLPPLTQTGAFTFGCLVNGKVWVPKGLLFSNKLTITYDPGWRGGSLVITARRKDNLIDQSIAISSDNLQSTGIYSLIIKDTSLAYFDDVITGCVYYSYRDLTTPLNGSLTITKFDLNKNIISGTFFFKLAKPGCDTITVSDGRFDLKL
ncbi:MAG: hypothetical protein K2Q24_05205 [Chitinophagaceae bacterium]|nr:hypothetical protein [Chitinophagaceae bacterium]